MNSSLLLLSPIDTRYEKYTKTLRNYCSEYALIYYRIFIEIKWIQHLYKEKKIPELHKINDNIINKLENIILNFNHKDALVVKEIEKTTNHDVKSIEYFLQKEMIKDKELTLLIPFIHFGCTSEDINNISYALMLKNSINKILYPEINNVRNTLAKYSLQFCNNVMLSRTHGQSASTTTVGKEFANFIYRLDRQLLQLSKIEYLGKFNGAVGNFNAHYIAYPNLDWNIIAERFITSLGITYNPLTTQIEPHDYIAECFDCLSRINTIFIDFTRDMWGYISLNYFKQKNIVNEIGSSTMPHKINPIDFENAEGNLGLSNNIMNFLSRKLPISRYQRDLTDSTLLRNLGLVLGYSVISYKKIVIGINKIDLNKEFIVNELQNNIQILGEAIQTIMRKFNIEKGYEKLKVLMRGKKILLKDLHIFIDSINLPHHVKKMIKGLHPIEYSGIAEKLCKMYIKIKK